MLVRFILALLLFFTSSAWAVASDEQLEQLAQSKQWSHLLHYRTHPYSLRYQSQNDSPNFFLSAKGKKDRLAELKADLEAFLKTNQADNQSAQCRFPARYFWLKQQLATESFVDQPCSEFESWRQLLNARYITLIFPAAHINSPSSMYGHTFIRLDREDESSNKLLAYSVNFAANADPTDNELVFSYKGLFGGYPGVVSVMPYYAKTNEYSHMEARDIWEYRLNLSKPEVDQFVRHIWETKDVYFDYFFFDENCSYRLLALLDAASERVDAADDFYLSAMPVDTIRALQQRGLVEQVDYRPSSIAELENKSKQVNKTILKVAKRLVNEQTEIKQILSEFDNQQKAQSLELAYGYARYLAIKKKDDSPELRQRTILILSERAKLAEVSNFSAVQTPLYRDDQGHFSQRLNLALGKDKQDGFVDLSYRIAFHELMDLPQGFVAGSQIQMGRVDARIWENHGIKLQHFYLFDVLSLSEQTHFQNPIAWGVSAGLERFLGQDAELYGYLKVGFGQAYVTKLGRVYGLAEAQLLADDQFNHNAQLSLGPRFGWLWQGERVQAQLEGNWQGLTVFDNTKRTQVTAQMGYRLSQNLQALLQAKYQRFDHQATAEQQELSLGVNWYF